MTDRERAEAAERALEAARAAFAVERSALENEVARLKRIIAAADRESIQLDEEQDAELARRIDALKAGTAVTIPWPEAREHLWVNAKREPLITRCRDCDSQIQPGDGCPWCGGGQINRGQE